MAYPPQGMVLGSTTTSPPLPLALTTPDSHTFRFDPTLCCRGLMSRGDLGMSRGDFGMSRGDFGMSALYGDLNRSPGAPRKKEPRRGDLSAPLDGDPASPGVGDLGRPLEAGDFGRGEPVAPYRFTAEHARRRFSPEESRSGAPRRCSCVVVRHWDFWRSLSLSFSLA